MPDETLVRVDEVVVPRNRLRSANHVEELAESIRLNGLLHPITLRRDGRRLVLVAGKRRLDAVKYLKEGTIRARVLDLDETQALLIEIDENLQRAELTALQHARHVHERKKVWEGLHPETKHGGAPGKRGGKGGKAPGKDCTVQSLPGCRPESFVQSTAKVTQSSKATVSRSAQIGENLCRKAQTLLEGTTVEDRQTDLLRISKLPKDEQVAVARLIHDEEATTYQRAKKMLEATRIAAEPRPLPTGPFRVVVADPPWHFAKRPHDATKRETTPYATMTLGEIEALPVAGLAEADAVLWLWTTNAHLPESFRVAAAWGFAYKTLLTWDKVRVGMGDWLRGQTEHCLLCVRGKATVILAGQTTLVRETSGGHSVKPEAFYALVESLCPGSKVELFSRKARPGWQRWGYDGQSRG